MLNRGHVVDSETIVEALWGGDPPARAEENVAILVSRLRGLLGAEAIRGGRGGYLFVPGLAVEVDLDEAGDLAAEAGARLDAGEAPLAWAAADRALHLLGNGRLLEEEASPPWAEAAQAATRQLLRRSRQAGWRAALQLGDHRGALGIARDAVADDAYDEEAHRAVMLAHQAGGEQAAALAAYERLRERLAEDLGADPSAETQLLHLSLLRNEAPLQEEAARCRPPPAPAPDFVGRSPELERLVGAWAAASSGEGRLVLISGEAGIGKTRLAEEVAAVARRVGGTVLQARCYEAERSLFLEPVVEAIRSLVVTLPPDELRDAAGDWAGTLGELVPELARILRPLGYERAAPELERRRSFEAVASLLQRLGRRRPVLVVLDDLHQAGASTVELLHFAVKRLARARLLALATIRAEEAGWLLDTLGELAEVVEVGPLTPAAVRELAARTRAEDLAEEITRKTRGHTLFVVEALRAIAEARAQSPDDLGAMPVPSSLRSAVLVRARRIGPQADELLRAAVVIGSAFSLDMAAELAGVPVDDAVRAAEQALQARLIVEAGGGYEFSNDLIREILYNATPLPTRIVRHRRAAALVRDNPEAVATHAAAAGDWLAALDAWTEAAERAAVSFANRDAERLLDRALSAAAHVEDPSATARVRLLRGKVREALADYQGAHRDHSTALQLARAACDPAQEAEALERLAWTAYYAREWASAHELAARAHEFAERAAGAAGALPSAFVILGRLRHARGDLQGGLAAYEQAIERATDPAVAALGRTCLGQLYDHADRFADATRLLDRGLEECSRAGLFRPVVTGMQFAAMARANLGDFGGALAALDRMQRLVDEADAAYHRPRALNVGSWIWRELGELPRARDLAQESLELTSAPTPGIGQEPRTHAVMAAAECALLAGDNAGAAELLAMVEPFRGQDVAYGWRFELRRVELLARLDPPVAATLLDLARAAGSRKYEALALAHLGRPEEAADVAKTTGSDLLLATVATGPEAQQAVDRIARSLPEDLRPAFVARGRVPALVARQGRGQAAAQSPGPPRP